MNGSKGPEYIKALAWPLLTVLILFLFWSPLHDIAGILPEVIRNSETIEAGKVKLSIRKSAMAKASEPVRQALRDLKASDIRTILQTDPGPHTFLFCEAKESDESIQEFRGLEGKKLVEALKADRLKAESTGNDPACGKERLTFGFETTSLWSGLREFLIQDLIPDLISQAQNEPTVVTKSESKKSSAK